MGWATSPGLPVKLFPPWQTFPRFRPPFVTVRPQCMNTRAELEEIAHTGGKITFDIKVDGEGRTSMSLQWTHSRPTAASVFGVYALPQGIAVGEYDLGGLGASTKAPPIPDCFPVLISSDSTGMFGHECPTCGGYWRDRHGGTLCPYCAFKAEERYQLFTDAQRRYIHEYCGLLGNALGSGKSGQYVIDMDAVADAARKNCKKPPFYYAEERQQNLSTVRLAANRMTSSGRTLIAAAAEHEMTFKSSKRQSPRLGRGQTVKDRTRHA